MRISSAGAVNIYAGTSQKDVLNVSGDYNEYTAMGVKNLNSGNKASSDVVATNNSNWYIDMGINSTNYTGGNSNILNDPNKGYLYLSAPASFYIGNGYPNQDLVFFTNTGPINSNNTADGTERMRLNGAGEFLIGTSTVTPGYNLQVDGNILSKGNVVPEATNTYDIGTTALRWRTLWTNNVLNTSDRRMKTNIARIQYGLNEVMKLQPVSYNWKKTPNTDSQIGLIAQEVKKVIPEIVVGDEDKETLSMNYTALIPVLINAIKEQQKQIDDLKKQVESLQK
jgi:hypothetical protein